MAAPPAFSLRSVHPEDAPWLWELKIAALRTYVELTWGEWNEPQQRAFFERGFTPQTLRIITIENEGDAGVLELARRGSEFFITRLELLPRFQRRGIGSAIIQGIQLEAGLANKPVRLQVLRVNPARLLYRKLGFTEVGETSTHVLMSWFAARQNSLASPPD